MTVDLATALVTVGTGLVTALAALGGVYLMSGRQDMQDRAREVREAHKTFLIASDNLRAGIDAAAHGIRSGGSFNAEELERFAYAAEDAFAILELIADAKAEASAASIMVSLRSANGYVRADARRGDVSSRLGESLSSKFAEDLRVAWNLRDQYRVAARRDSQTRRRR